MIAGEKVARAREAVEVLAADCKLSYAALIVSSVALGYELFR